MESKTKLVACEYNEQGECINATIVKNLTETEYRRLVNESNVAKQVKKDNELKKEKLFKKLDEKTSKAYFILAKLVYDSLVDRGYIDDDNEFEIKWHNYILNGEVIDEFPQTILEIVERLGAL